jgi:hypothetical protein
MYFFKLHTDRSNVDHDKCLNSRYWSVTCDDSQVLVYHDSSILKILYVVIEVVTTLKSNLIYVYIYAFKTIFKHQRICKICTANICAHYMLSLKYMHSFLIGKFDFDFIEHKFLITSLYLQEMLNSVISL